MIYFLSLALGMCVLLLLAYAGALLWVPMKWIWRIFFSKTPWQDD